jgi:phosphoglycolate phosphatase
VIGLGLNDALAHVLPGVAPSGYGAVVERYRHHFLLADGGTTLFSGVYDMIRGLRDEGHLLAIATGKSRRGLDRALEGTGLRQYFDATRCADEGHSKPHPGMLQWIIEALSTSPERTLMIGDTTHDLQLALNAGTASVGVSYGAHDHASFAGFGTRHVAHSVVELHDWLVRHG